MAQQRSPGRGSFPSVDECHRTMAHRATAQLDAQTDVFTACVFAVDPAVVDVLLGEGLTCPISLNCRPQGQAADVVE